MQLEFEIVLQDDREMIYQNNGTARRIVIHKFELWVPQLHVTGKGQTLINENFLKPTQRKYLKENMYSSGDKGTRMVRLRLGVNTETQSMSSYSFNNLVKKILTHKTLIFLTHLISMVITRQDCTIAN